MSLLILSRVNRQRLKTSSFRQAEHKVHILDGLPGCSLDQIVNATNNDEPPRPVVNGGVNEAKVVSPGVLGVGWEFYHFYKGLILVKVQIELS